MVDGFFVVVTHQPVITEPGSEVVVLVVVLTVVLEVVEGFLVVVTHQPVITEPGSVVVVVVERRHLHHIRKKNV